MNNEYVYISIYLPEKKVYRYLRFKGLVRVWTFYHLYNEL